MASPGPVAVHNMDDEGPPLSSPLPLSQPAVQAPIDNPDAPPSPESTGADEGTPASDMVIMDDSAPASSSFLETNENKDDGTGEEPPSSGGGAPPTEGVSNDGVPSKPAP